MHDMIAKNNFLLMIILHNTQVKNTIELFTPIVYSRECASYKNKMIKYKCDNLFLESDCPVCTPCKPCDPTLYLGIIGCMGFVILILILTNIFL